MALQDMPLSDLQSAVSLNGADLFYVVQSGESKKVTLAVMIGNKADLENGLVPLRELPNSVVMVANDTERFALDSDEVNNGFIVLQYDSTHPEISAKMFLVIDNTNLDSEAGYQPFAADAIWGNIINRPTNLAYLAGDDEELPSVSPVLRESNLQNNLVTTLPNYPLDARQGKVLDDKITAVNQNLTDLAWGTAIEITPNIVAGYVFEVPAMGVIAGEFRKTANTKNGSIDIRSDCGVAYKFLASVPPINGGCTPIHINVVRGEKITFRQFAEINFSDSHIWFQPYVRRS